jgi:hypothetical protein
MPKVVISFLFRLINGNLFINSGRFGQSEPASDNNQKRLSTSPFARGTKYFILLFITILLNTCAN